MELQAWFAGRTLLEQDRYITEIRLTTNDTIREILEFVFYTENEEYDRQILNEKISRETSRCSDVYYDAQESLEKPEKNDNYENKGETDDTDKKEENIEFSDEDDLRLCVDVF